MNWHFIYIELNWIEFMQRARRRLKHHPPQTPPPTVKRSCSRLRGCTLLHSSTSELRVIHALKYCALMQRRGHPSELRLWQPPRQNYYSRNILHGCAGRVQLSNIFADILSFSLCGGWISYILVYISTSCKHTVLQPRRWVFDAQMYKPAGPLWFSYRDLCAIFCWGSAGSDIGSR